MASMPLVDVVALWRGVPRWSMHEENTARLLDVLEWRAEVDYAQWTTPADEVALQRALALRSGKRPPPHPAIIPVAMRPEPVHEQRWQQLQRLLGAADQEPSSVYLTQQEAEQYFA